MAADRLASAPAAPAGQRPGGRRVVQAAQPFPRFLAAPHVTATWPRRVLAPRRTVVGYVSQFLRVTPRVGALEIVAAAGREGGLVAGEAERRAAEPPAPLNLPERLWRLPPATFSGGEQQRVNIARGLVADRPVLLLDEPTAALDARNHAVVVDLVERKKRAGRGSATPAASPR